MSDNMESAHGLPMAEALSMTLAGYIGRSEAHALVERAVRSAADDNRWLADVAGETGDITSHVSAVEIRRLLQPENYLGAAQAFVTRVLERYRADKEG